MTDAGVEARRLAIGALVRIDTDGAYANLILPHLLEDSALDQRDRAFATELVYGATRMRRAVDYLADRFVERSNVDASTRAALRIGAYQLHFLGTPPHAAVDATVAASPKRARGFVNAILRRIANSTVTWPSDGIRLSYPDWILDRLQADLGTRAIAVLEAMNQPATVHVRSDGYRQDPASQLVVELVGEAARVLDVCAGPGGKATGLAHGCAQVVGTDIHPHRARLVRSAAESTDTAVDVVVADGTRPPFAPASFDAILVDAPCSGIGSLRRRPDARWRIGAGDVDRLAELQFGLVEQSLELLAPGGRLVYTVCTLTDAESVGVDGQIERRLPRLAPASNVLGEPWEPHGRGGRLVPDRFAGDGMTAFVYRLDG